MEYFCVVWKLEKCICAAYYITYYINQNQEKNEWCDRGAYVIFDFSMYIIYPTHNLNTIKDVIVGPGNYL